MPDATGKCFRVVSWNIHGCIGPDGRTDPDRIARVIRALDPDAIALQEVDSRRGRHNGIDIFEFFRDIVGEHAIEAKSISTLDGHYGQMLISRKPLHRHHIHDISMKGREPRKAMEAEIVTQNGPLRLIATHLGLQRRERRQQLKTLAEIVGDGTDLPCALIGDLNDWHRQARRYLSPHLEAHTSHRTYPARLPIFPLDRIWCRPGTMLSRSWAELRARDASDHLPIVAELNYDRPSAPVSGRQARERYRR